MSPPWVNCAQVHTCLKRGGAPQRLSHVRVRAQAECLCYKTDLCGPGYFDNAWAALSITSATCLGCET